MHSSDRLDALSAHLFLYLECLQQIAVAAPEVEYPCPWLDQVDDQPVLRRQ